MFNTERIENLEKELKDLKDSLKFYTKFNFYDYKIGDYQTISFYSLFSLILDHLNLKLEFIAPKPDEIRLVKKEENERN